MPKSYGRTGAVITASAGVPIPRTPRKSPPMRRVVVPSPFAYTPVDEVLRQQRVEEGRVQAREREITNMYADVEVPIGEIAEKFGIHVRTVAKIAMRHGAAKRPDLRAKPKAMPSDEVRAQIVARFEQGVSRQAILAEFHIGQPRLARILEESGAVRQVTPRTPPVLSVPCARHGCDQQAFWKPGARRDGWESKPHFCSRTCLGIASRGLNRDKSAHEQQGES